MMADVGSALTGQQVEPAAAASQWDDYLQRPGNRQALLQIGLQMMQPHAMGQTTGGHIAQAIGAGGEAVGRMETSDLKADALDAKMANMDARLAQTQQVADAGTLRANAAALRAKTYAEKAGKGLGITEAMRLRMERQDAAAYEKRLDSDAKALEKQANQFFPDPPPSALPYKGKTAVEIREMLRKERPAPKGKAGASLDLGDGTDPDEDDPASEAEASASMETQPPAGFQKYNDGNFYKPDPKNPGKVLRWKP